MAGHSLQKHLALIFSIFYFSLFFLTMAGASMSTQGTSSGHVAERVLIAQKKPVDFPTRDIRFICPQSPGGAFDTYSRMLVPFLKKHLPKKTNIIVENVTGAGWRVGVSKLLNSKPDGYTIGILNIPGNVVDQLVGNVDWDLNKVTWIGKITENTYQGALSPKSKLKTVEDLQKSETVKVGTTGLSSSGGLGVLIFAEALGIKLKPVVHDGAKEAILSAIRGDVDYVQFPFRSMEPYTLDSKELIPIVHFTPDRLSQYPNVKTIGEYGHSELLSLISQYVVVGGPKDMPEEITQLWRDTMKMALEDQEFAAQMKKTKDVALYGSGPEVQKLVTESLVRYGKYKDILQKNVK